jgi:hypothetical protein
VFIAILPILCIIVEVLFEGITVTIGLFAKWFVFCAVGLRLFVAGIKQVINPGFTALHIFGIDDTAVLPIVRELGFANISFGLLGIVSLFLPEWRVASAFVSGVYYGLAALQHIIKKPAGANEKFALVTDVIVFLLLLVYCFYSIGK